MAAKAIQAQQGVKIEFDHVFSCEIEPFKQAYIERNFAPAILFRDVTELGRKKAHTAYGSLIAVPGKVDVCWIASYPADTLRSSLQEPLALITRVSTTSSRTLTPTENLVVPSAACSSG
jgi:hypothetical protein